MGAMYNCPSTTPKLLFCRSFCVRTSLRASAVSDASMMSNPITLSSAAPRVAAAVPAHMPTTVSETRGEGISMRSRQSMSRVTVGVKALSIWMKPTGKNRYTALPHARVADMAAPIGARFSSTKRGVIRWDCRGSTTRQTFMSTTEESEAPTRPRPESAIGKLKPTSLRMCRFTRIRVGPTVRYTRQATTLMAASDTGEPAADLPTADLFSTADIRPSSSTNGSFSSRPSIAAAMQPRRSTNT
mmetsp:Transcript_10345/g.34247  ORF Transcript_10345/g.34247 Transcript_10345/m.34247 type:complete len:243 (+) Transcript_10345:597-1325(+)